MITLGLQIWGKLPSSAAAFGPFGALAVVFGVVLILWGLRGRKLNDVPLCRRCGFDLSGLPGAGIGVAAGIGSVLPEGSRCGECGLIVTEPRRVLLGIWTRRGVVFGRRKRRRVPIVAGAVVLLLATGLTSGRGTLTRLLLPVTPAPILLKAAGAGERLARQVRAELEARLQRGTLTSSDGVWLAGSSAELANRDTSWADLVIAARAAGVVDDASFASFLFAACPVKLELREKVREGRTLPVRLSNAFPSKPHGLRIVNTAVDWRIQRITWRGVEVRRPIGNVPSKLNEAWSLTFQVNVTGPIGPGELVIEGVKEAVVYDDTGNERHVLGSMPFRLQGVAEVVPENVRLVEALEDPSAGPVIADAISITNLRCIPRTSTRWRGNERVPVWMYTAEISRNPKSKPSRHPLSFDLIAHWSGGQAPLGTLFLDAGSETTSVQTSSGELTVKLPDEVDIELRSSPSPAETSVGASSYWQGRLMFRNVKVEQATGAESRERDPREQRTKAEYLPDSAR